MTEAMYYVLLALSTPLHGYAMMEAVQRVSSGRIKMGPGTLYGILKRLQKNHLIFLEEADGRRKVYQITNLGREALELEYKRLISMVEDGAWIVRGGDKA
ncbi:helix-turn-helix transcriptional regulator [Bacillus sp. YZJH907-2]|uniref:Helix-turn-helix transcriptional regulator n=2 Tax=Halalkalibacter suaedae TaxID=2822140 RepID=A0A940WZV0_9BACI|nr:helix-turn-helix transcriptional regulator [Bacillus suaedae]